MNEFGKICTEVNTRIVQDTVWFVYHRITDDDPFGIDNHINEFVARIGGEEGRKFKFRVLMNRNTHDRLNEAYSRRISMFNQGKEEPARGDGYQDNHVHDRFGRNRNGKYGTRR